jgi:uncharacterized 2Fe-2S/4Fe-4S cluster protein (DUF4445 family)
VPAIDPERVHFVGNAAGVGARMALVDAHYRARARHIAGHCTYLELAGHAGYEDAFIKAIPLGERLRRRMIGRGRPSPSCRTS